MAWNRLNANSMISRDEYGGFNTSLNLATGWTGTSIGGSGGGSARPYSAATFASILPITRSASSMRPFCASQRGLSGTARRMNHTMTAPPAPSSTTQRQPSSPIGAIGTSQYESNAATGAALNITA